MNFFEKIERELKRILEQIRDILGQDGQDEQDEPDIPTPVPGWEYCTLASCWEGSNAQHRMMNILSPHMPDSKFNDYMNWMKGRGCNTSHLFIANLADGEYGGYSIYGRKWSWGIDKQYCDFMKSRIKTLRKNGFAIVIWLMADDSAAYSDALKTNFLRYVRDVKTQGFFDVASTVVVGLELDEYYTESEVKRLCEATKSVYSGKIATHQCSGKYAYHKYADILFYQTATGKTESQIESEVRRIKKNIGGKPINAFEISRNPARKLCEAAFRGGAFAVGNW